MPMQLCVFVGAMKFLSFQIVVLVWQNVRSNAHNRLQSYIRPEKLMLSISELNTHKDVF